MSELIGGDGKFYAGSLKSLMQCAGYYRAVLRRVFVDRDGDGAVLV